MKLKLHWQGEGIYGISPKGVVRKNKGLHLIDPREAHHLFFVRMNHNGWVECADCRELYPLEDLADLEVEFEGTKYLLPICLNCLPRWEADVLYRKGGEKMFWRNGERLFVVTPHPEGEIEVRGARFKILEEITDPKERLRLDPLGELAASLGLVECPYHPGVFYRESEDCPVCLEEMVERLREEIKDGSLV